MKIILTDEVRGLGRRGDVVDVKNGYARNFLLPQGFAFLANPANVRRLSSPTPLFDDRFRKPRRLRPIESRHDRCLVSWFVVWQYLDPDTSHPFVDNPELLRGSVRQIDSASREVGSAIRDLNNYGSSGAQVSDANLAPDI